MNSSPTLNLIKTPRQVAARWIGTPWRANSDVCGPNGGVSCHLLPRAILVEAGLLSHDFPKVIGDPHASRHSTHSIIEAFLDARPEFQRLEFSPGSLPPLEPGDLLGFRLRSCIDHLGLVLSGNQFIHVLLHQCTTLDPIPDPTWSRRIRALWRRRVAAAL
jgi:hypothetical protein